MVMWILGIILLTYSVICRIQVHKERRRLLLAAERLDNLRKIEGIARGKWKGKTTHIGRDSLKRRVRKF